MPAKYVPVYRRRRGGHRVNHETGCWEWQGSMVENGYGVVSVNGANIKAHRRYYEVLVGPIPPGLDLDHLCRNRACVNPDHLEPVTRSVNLIRGNKGRCTPEFVESVYADWREYAASWGRTKTLAEKYKCSQDTIRNAVRMAGGHVGR